jgi:hypothetical protein
MMLSKKTPTTGHLSGKKQKKLALTMLAMALAAILAPSALSEEAISENASIDGDLFWDLVLATDAVSSNISQIDRALQDASLALSDTGIEGIEAQQVLTNLTAVGPWVIDCITFDLNGTIIEVEPDEYRYIAGMSVIDQEHNQQLLSTGRPVGLAYFETVQGFYAMVFGAPIFDEEGRLMGAVTVLVNSTEFFGTVLGPYQPGNSAKIEVSTPDGTVLYDTDAEQIGKNTITDPLFAGEEDLLALAKRAETERTGTGTYEIFGITRQGFWTTVDYQGREIRLILSVDVEVN